MKAISCLKVETKNTEINFWSVSSEGIWVMMLYSVVVGYQHFRGPSYLHLLHRQTTVQGSNYRKMMTETANFSKMLESYNTTWHHILGDNLRR